MKQLSSLRHFRVALTLILLGGILFLATPGKVSASACTTVKDGTWSNKRTWDCDHSPTTTDTVTIRHTVELNIPNVTVAGVTISTGGSLMLFEKTNIYNLTVTGDVTNSGIVSAGTTAGSIFLTGNWVNNATYTAGIGKITFNGTSPQTIGGSASTTFYDLTINNPAGISLGAAQTVTHALTLTSGRVALGAYNLTLASSVASVSGAVSASAMVVTNGSGALCKGFSAAGSFTFPVGDATPNYTPATLNFTAGTFSSGQACLRVINAKHPNNPLTADYINRYWTVTSSGISNFSCSVEMTYVQADFTGTDEAGMSGLHYHAGSWTSLNAVDAANNKISGTVSGFSDFTAGKVGPTAVELNYFRAARAAGGVQLAWETVSEATLAGFNLYRLGMDEDSVKINAELIPPQKGGQPEGYAYLYLDDSAALDQRYEYRLEGIETTLQVGSAALATYWPYSLMLPVMRR